MLLQNKQPAIQQCQYLRRYGDLSSSVDHTTTYQTGAIQLGYSSVSIWPAEYNWVIWPALSFALFICSIWPALYNWATPVCAIGNRQYLTGAIQLGYSCVSIWPALYNWATPASAFDRRYTTGLLTASHHTTGLTGAIQLGYSCVSIWPALYNWATPVSIWPALYNWATSHLTGAIQLGYSSVSIWPALYNWAIPAVSIWPALYNWATPVSVFDRRYTTGLLQCQ